MVDDTLALRGEQAGLLRLSGAQLLGKGRSCVVQHLVGLVESVEGGRTAALHVFGQLNGHVLEARRVILLD